jgi:hypothetical protein
MAEDDVIEKILGMRRLAASLALAFIALLAGFFFIPGAFSGLIRGQSDEFGFLMFFGVPLAFWVVYELLFSILIRCPNCRGRLSEGYLSGTRSKPGTLHKSSCIHCHMKFESSQ